MSFVIRCGTPDCDWGKRMPDVSEEQLDLCYSWFRKHCIQMQGWEESHTDEGMRLALGALDTDVAQIERLAWLRWQLLSLRQLVNSIVALDEKFSKSDPTLMPNPLVSPFGKRQPRALVIGLRAIVKDPKATVTQRLEACKLLAIVEGYIEPHSGDRVASVGNPSPLSVSPASPATPNPANASRLRELLEKSDHSA